MDDAISTLAEIDRRWESLTISNDFVFCKAMLDPDLCKEVVETILGIEVDHVEHIERQEVLDAAPASKSVRLDVYVRDGLGTVYDVEMQSIDTHELAQRTRYYLSLMSLDQIARGQRYMTLKGAYVVFVCGFDPFGRGSRVYSFQNRCDEMHDLVLGDGAKAVFLSTVSPSREDGPRGKLDEFIDYVASGRVSGDLSARLDAAVARVLDNREWRLEYMMLEVRDQLNFEKGVTEGRMQGEAIGLRKGLEQGEAEGLKRGLEQGEAEGLKKGLEQGEAEGLKKGLEQGEAEGLKKGLEQGMAKGLREGLEQGEAEGLRKGLEQGEARLAELVSKLVTLGRSEELCAVGTDAALREKLYAEFGIA